MGKLLRYILPAAVLTLPMLASAHEAYVLDHASIVRDLTTPSPNPVMAFYSNKFQFFLWGFIAFVTVSSIFCMSIFRIFETLADPLLDRLKRYAPVVERITLGLSLLAFAYNAALFGPELPMSEIYGSFAPVVQTLFYLTGVLIFLGLFTRTSALVVILIALCSIPAHGAYMLMYTAYFVVAVVIFIMGSGSYSIDHLLGRTRGRNYIERLRIRFAPYEMVALRLGFGFSVIAAAVYAKFLHTNLALDVISEYHLTNYFHFEPLFIVLGAFIIESLIGLFIMLGIEIRWTAFFFLFWLTLSLLYFGESVWPHLALFGLNIMLFFHGYDRYSAEGFLFKKGSREPVF